MTSLARERVPLGGILAVDAFARLYRGQVLAWRGGLRVADQGREARVTVSVIDEAPIDASGRAASGEWLIAFAAAGRGPIMRVDVYERGDR